ncbi:ABC transporter permease [Clostridium septicum]|uniref:ABC transporter permease n=1 Tax=Clostridium septicum TaxID=1504 RepID=A0A9N7PMC3_CLOSE|nr:ABC transporter permease [Clostridium septicum]AYE34922.1 ABC transporter permease [Clostridium septicum]MDU1313859.1 ABC transporter permease [Clostridium septicum]QAS60316.1 ABC transporter permease [Clostridium septicum]UEC20429.1 ABC transporter permease [Clostridium septicum]USS01514.1 ABC transporter permease [Clostridium septicum]
MLNLIRAELYKYSKRPFMYVYAGMLSLGILLIPILSNFWTVGIEYITREFIYTLIGSSFMGILIFSMLFGIVLQEEYKEKTLKNIIVSDISKTKIYIAKYISQVILGLILSAMCLIIFFIAISMVRTGDGYSSKLVGDFLIRFLVSIPMYMAGIALGDILVVLFKQSGMYALVYYFIIIFTPKVIDMLAWKVCDKIALVKSYLLTEALNKVIIPYPPIESMLKSLAISTMYIIVCLIIGIILINRREVK